MAEEIDVVGGYAAGRTGHCGGCVVGATKDGDGFARGLDYFIEAESLESSIEAEIDGVSRRRRNRGSSRQGVEASRMVEIVLFGTKAGTMALY